MPNTYIILMAVIALLIIAFGVVAILQNKKKKRLPDYRAIFYLGIVFTVIGVTYIATMDYATFLILGIVFMGVGIANKDKWKDSQETSPQEKKLAMAAILLGAVVFGALLYIYTKEQDRKEDIASTVVVENMESDNLAVPSDLMMMQDYYLKLPDKYLGFIAENISDREEQIEVIDEGNFYLKLKDVVGPGPGSDHATLTAFIKPNNEKVLAVSYGHCAELCFNEFVVLDYVDGMWVEITEELFPAIDENTYINKAHEQSGSEGLVEGFPYSISFTLPQYGTDILIHEDLTGLNVGTIKWRDGVFVEVE